METRDRLWIGKALALILLLIFVRTFPKYEAMELDFARNTWRDIQTKFDHPLADLSRDFPAGSHISNSTFRITVPAVARSFGLRQRGLMLLSAIAGVVLLFLILNLSLAITSSRKIAFLVCLSAACTWSGETAFHELRGGYYDAVALCLMVAAFAARSWPVAAVLLFLGAWTDERALVGAAFLLLFDLCRRGTAGWRSGAAFSALVAYFVVRMASTWILSYQLGPTGGVGLDLFVKQASFMPFAVLSALGGNWVVTGAGMGALIAARRFGLAIGLGVSLIVLVLVSFSVADISRSLAYCLPAVFVALAAVADNMPLTLQLERGALPAGIVALLLPAIYVEGSSGVYLLESLSMKLWAGM